MKHLELEDASEWPRDGARHRVLLVSLNVPGYYSLPARILALMAARSDDLRRRYDVRYAEWEQDEGVRIRLNPPPGGTRDTILPLAERITAWQPDIIGFSVNIWNRNSSFRLAAALKERLPDVCLLAGGQEMTGSLVDYLALAPPLDYIVDGEGEVPFCQFLENWGPSTRRVRDPSAVSGLRYRDGAENRLTREAEILPDLDAVPSAVLAGLVPISHKNKLGVLVEGTRGCPFRCSFCFEGARRCKVRMASLERIAREVEAMAARGATSFHMMDPILCNSQPDRLRAISELFKEIGRKYARAYVSVEAYGDQITDEVAQYLGEIAMVDVGLQSTNPETIKAIHRPYKPDRFRQGVERLRRTRATTNLYLISGLPYETMLSFLEGLRFTLDQQPTRLFLNELCLLNGTELRERAEEYDYVFDPDPPYRVKSSRWMSFREMALVNSLSQAVSRAYSLSARSISFTLPWMDKPAGEGGATLRIDLAGACTWGCDGCASAGEGAPKADIKALAGQLDVTADQDVELIAGDGLPLQDVLHLAAQIHFCGAARIRLVTPMTFFAEADTVKALVNCGVWHYRTFVDLRNKPLRMDDLRYDAAFTRAMEDLKKLNVTFRLQRRGEIRPFVEVVFLTGDKTIEELWEVVRYIGQSSSVVALPDLRTPDSVAWLDHPDSGYEDTVRSRFWIKLTEPAMRHVLRDTSKLDEVIGHLKLLGLVCSESEQPPCRSRGTGFRPESAEKRRRTGGRPPAPAQREYHG